MATNARSTITTIEELRELISHAGTHAPREFLESKTFGTGLPRGAISQILGRKGTGKTRALLSFLTEHPTLRVAWIESTLEIFPPALVQNQVSLERVYFIEADTHMLWCALEALRSQLFGVIVLSDFQGSEKNLRQLQLAAERAGCAVILLDSEPRRHSHWSIGTQIEIEDNQPQLRKKAL